MAKRISGDYDKNGTKDELQAEADARNLTVTGTGANGAVIKEDLVKALNNSDNSGAAGGKPFAESLPSNIPKVSKEEPLGGAEPTPPADEFTLGTFKRKSDGEEYALAVVPMNPLNGRTHRLMNSLHYWEGTEQQFITDFSGADGKPLRLGDYPPKDAPKDYLPEEEKK